MRKTLLILVAAILVAFGAAAAALYAYNQPTTLRIAVPQLIEDQKLVAAAASFFAHQRESVRLKIVSAADSAASAAALDSGHVDLAVVRSDFAMPANAQALLVIHRNVALLVAPGGSRVKRIGDLRGKRIGVIHETASMDANVRLLETILVQYDVSPKSVAMLSLAPTEARAAVVEGRVDALFSVAVPQSGLANDLVAALTRAGPKAPVFIPVSQAKAIARRAPALEPMEILPGAFGGDPPRPEAAVETIGVSYLMLARSSMTNALAADVTRLFLSNHAAIAHTAPLANAIEAPSTEKNAVISAHKGAADYLEGNETSFFDKYSDAFYIGAMLLSLVGSGAAALATRFNVSAHHRTEELAERLLEILQAARIAATPAELDDYERTVDDVFANALADRRLRGADATGLHVVSMALDQARRAIRERRKFLVQSGRVVSLPAHKSLTAVE